MTSFSPFSLTANPVQFGLRRSTAGLLTAGTLTATAGCATAPAPVEEGSPRVGSPGEWQGIGSDVYLKKITIGGKAFVLADDNNDPAMVQLPDNKGDGLIDSQTAWEKAERGYSCKTVVLDGNELAVCDSNHGVTLNLVSK